MGIIMLTGRLLSEDKVSGLSLGADHYPTKPVNLAELGATLVSLSRRLRVVPSPDPARAEGVWRFDPARRQLLSPTRVNVDITDTESRLLGALIQAAPLRRRRAAAWSRRWAPAPRPMTPTAWMPTCTGCAAAARAGRRRHGHTHGLRRRLRLHHARADRGRRQGQGLNPRHPPHRDASRHAPPPPPALYMPGANARALDKARGLDADVLILDLEDAVAPDAKPQARAGGRRLAGRRLRPSRMRGAHQRAGHAVGTGRRARPRRRRRRRRAAAQGRKPGPAGRAGAGIGRGRRARRPSLVGHVRNAVGLSASGRHRRPSPAGGPGRGHVGPGQDLHARHTPGREETLLARSLAVMAARAHGLAALDGVHLDLDDEAGLALACEQGRNQGFDGKTLIHPRQIAAANAAYAPSPGRSPSRASGCRPGAMPRPAARASRWSTVRWWKTCTRAKPNACWRWPLPSPPPERAARSPSSIPPRQPCNGIATPARYNTVPHAHDAALRGAAPGPAPFRARAA